MTLENKTYSNLARNILFFGITLIGLLSCGGGNSSSSNVVSRGVFYSEAASSQYFEDISPVFQEFGNQVSTELTNKFKLPSNDILISFKDCGNSLDGEFSNSYYDSRNSEVVMCYELFYDLFTTYEFEKAASIYTFVLVHEISHAFIDEMNLPIVGGEENAADSISTVLLLEDSETLEERKEGARSAVLAGDYFNTLFNTGGGLWTDTHAIGPQRLFNLVCWAGGGEPSILDETSILQIYSQMVTDNRNCPAEYQQQKNSTNILLAPYRK